MNKAIGIAIAAAFGVATAGPALAESGKHRLSSAETQQSGHTFGNTVEGRRTSSDVAPPGGESPNSYYLDGRGAQELAQMRSGERLGMNADARQSPGKLGGTVEGRRTPADVAPPGSSGIVSQFGPESRQ